VIAVGARCYASAALAVMRCLSVRLFVTFVNCVKTNKHIFNFFSPSGSHIILLRTKCYGDIPTGTPFPLTGASNASGVGRNRDSKPKLRAVNAATGQLSPTRCRRTTVLQVVTLIAGSKRRSLLMAGDDGEMFMTRNLNVTPKTRQQYLTARSDKSAANVTNNKTVLDVLYCWS